MAHIIISSETPNQAERWASILSEEHKTKVLHDLNKIPENTAHDPINLVVIDAKLLDSSFSLLVSLAQLNLKILVIGQSWSDDKQIEALASGCSGYCEIDTADHLLLKAANHLLTGDIWIQRHLIPRLINALAELSGDLRKNRHHQQDSENKLTLLSKRELDVAELIKTGESNKAIAARLNISERTVKAHLTSIFNKLEIPDRLHLALFLKEISSPK